jgi:hypothetical protein
MRKAKAEKDCKNMARQLKAQKCKSMVDQKNVVDRMRVVFEREKDVAVSDATVHLASDLKKSRRGVEGLQKMLGKSEVSLFSFAPHIFSVILFFYLGGKQYPAAKPSGKHTTNTRTRAHSEKGMLLTLTLHLTQTLTLTQSLTQTGTAWCCYFRRGMEISSLACGETSCPRR